MSPIPCPQKDLHTKQNMYYTQKPRDYKTFVMLNSTQNEITMISYKIKKKRKITIISVASKRSAVGHPEPEKKSVGIFSTFWHPCSKCILMCFKKDRGGCQVWKCPRVPELGQRSTKCKFLYIRQILAFLSLSYPKLWFKVMQNLFWIIQPCYINKQHHQGMMCVWIKGHLSAKSVKIVAKFYLYRGKIQILSSLLS